MYTLTNQGEMPSAGETPVMVTINGIPHWQISGRTFPQVAGAEDSEGDADNEDQDAEQGSAEESRKIQAFRAERDKARKQRDELKAQVKELEALKAEKAERENADKSEAERAVARLSEMTKAHEEALRKAEAAEAKLRQVQLDRSIEQMAQKHNARNPAVVARLLDRDALEFDDDGTPSNAEALVKKLLHDEPYLVGGAPENRTGIPPTPRPGAPQGHAERVKENREKLIETGEYAPLG